MGKALVLKNTDFSTNKLTTVTLINNIPCTGISLSDSTKAMTAVGSTFTLTATVTPANTTDTVEWTSSDPTVATVNGGVVTQTGVGSATITATCGEQSATCAVTASNVLAFSYELGAQAVKRGDSGGNINDYGQVTTSSAGVRYCALFNDTVATPYRVRNLGAVSGYRYPIPLGAGAATVTADVPDWVKFTVWWFDANTMCDIGQTESDCAIYAKLLSGDSSPYDSSVSIGDRVMTVPEGANAAFFSLYVPSSTGHDSVTAEDAAAVTITVT